MIGTAEKYQQKAVHEERSWKGPNNNKDNLIPEIDYGSELLLLKNQ